MHTLLGLLTSLVFFNLYLLASGATQLHAVTAMSSRYHAVQATNKLRSMAAPEYIDLSNGTNSHNLADVEKEEDEAQTRLSNVILEAEQIRKNLEKDYEASTSGKQNPVTNPTVQKIKKDLEKHYKIGASSPAASKIFSQSSAEQEEEDSTTEEDDPELELKEKGTFPVEEEAVPKRIHKSDTAKTTDYFEKLRKREVNWQRRKNDKVAATIGMAAGNGKFEKPKTPFAVVEDYFKSLAQPGKKNVAMAQPGQKHAHTGAHKSSAKKRKASSHHHEHTK